MEDGVDAPLSAIIEHHRSLHTKDWTHMPLNGEQIKAIIASQVKNYEKRLVELGTELALLQSQPIGGSRELRKRLSYIERAQLEQRARLSALRDLQQILLTLEDYTSDG